MSLAAVKPPAAQGRPGPTTGAEPARMTLLKLAVFVVLLAAGSHLLMVRNPAFLALCEDRAVGSAAQALRIEATLRGLAPGEADVILVGSSLVTDLVPDRLAEHLGLAPAALVSLPLYSGNAADVAMVARHLARTRPRMVVFPASVWTLFGRADPAELRLYDPRMAWSLFGWRQLLASRQEHASLILGSLHFAVRHRAALRDILASSLPGGGLPAEEGRWAGRRDPLIGRRRRARMAARREEFVCPSVQTRALTITADHLEREGVLLVVVSTPANRDWDYDAGLKAGLDECLRALARRPGGLHVPFTALPSFGADDFIDHLHMNHPAAARFTDAVGAEIARFLGREQRHRHHAVQ